ncbi:AI-2E family transporter [Brachybacterium huguangmaarense]
MQTIRRTAPRPDPRPQEVEEIPLGMRRAAAWSWRVLIVVALGALILWALGHVMALVVPFLVAILLAALLSPVVGLLTRHTFLGRGMASAIALIGLIVVVVGMSTLVGQQLVAQFASIQRQAVVGFEQLTGWATATLRLDLPTIQAAQNELLTRLQANSDALVQGALSGVETVGTAITGVLICLFTLFFLLKDGASIWHWVLGLLPAPARVPTHEAFRRGWKALSAYCRTQILVATINGTGIGIGTAAIGLGSYAIPVFLIVFLFSFIPLIGAVVSGVIAALLVLVLQGWVMALVMVAIVIGVHFIEADILHPFMMGHAVRLHPLGVFLGVALGAETAGIAGALFAIPLAAFLNATLLQLAGRDPSPELGEDTSTASMLAARARELAAHRLRASRAARLAGRAEEALRQVRAARTGSHRA